MIMSQLRPNEIAEIFAKRSEKRYDYFIKKVADTEEVFGLTDDEGWLLLDDPDGNDAMPFFPGEEFAERFRVEGDFEEFEIGVLDVNELLLWLDDMEKDGVRIAVFPNLEMQGAVVSPKKLGEDLEAELVKYDEDGKKIQK